MVSWINGLRIKTKLVLIIFVTSLLSLTLAGGSLILYERDRVQSELVTNVTLLARIIADRSVAALLFNDDTVATENLETLKAKRDIVAAAIYDQSGNIFARYHSGEGRPYSFPDKLSHQDGIGFDGDFLNLTEPIFMEGEQIGLVFMRTSLRELELLWRNLLMFAGGIGFVALVFALLLASWLQRLVSGPLESLTRTVEDIGASKNYRLRAAQVSNDEVGTLVKAFNAMLQTIESRTGALTAANEQLAASQNQLMAMNDELEARVADRTSELQALFDTITVGVVLMRNRQIADCNHRLDEMLGYDRGEQIGKPTRIWYANTADWQEVGKSAYDQVIWRGNTYVQEVELIRKDGSTLWGRFSARAIDIEDRDKGVVLVVEDITAERAAMTEMARARELAEEATQMKSDFLANMSHEIRTPMNAIIGMLYLALKQDVPAHLQNYLTKAQGAAQSLLGIINDILDFSKIESGKLEMEQVEFGLDTVVEHLSDAMAFQAERKGLEFLIRYDVGIPPTLIGDPLRLGQILLNLCSNAVKFTESGEVELAFQCLAMSDDKLSLQISVRDTGIGMTEEVQSRLFQKFSQADESTTRRFGGTGLGLAICKHLVELMGGRVWIEDSKPGAGTTVCCTVNLGVAAQAEAHRHELLDQVGPLLKGMKVLVVDDNQVSREILAEMLRYFQMEVAVAGNGPDAIHLLEQGGEPPVELVLMDWRMPGMNGDQVAQRIRVNPAIRHQPRMVMVTAYGREDVMKLAEKAGVEHFLVKPVSPSTLLDTVLTTLGRGRLFQRSDSRDSVKAAQEVDLSGIRLLLVEDNDINREFAEELLHSLNIDVACAINGAEAVAMVQQGDYDGVLMDIQMPVMGGLEAAQRIRALAQQPGNERFATLPIIAMTALAMAKDVENSRAVGMNDHITKPIAPDHLVATLARWIKVEPRATGGQRPAASGQAAAQPTLPEMASLRVEQGIHRIGGRVEAYIKQLKRFREHYANGAGEMRRHLADRGTQAASEYCHSLKGVSGNIGAEALFNCLNQMEAELKAGVEPAAADLAHMEQLLQQVMADIDRLTDLVRPAPPVAAAKPVNGVEVSTLLTRLRHALDNDLGAAEGILSELQGATVGGPLAPAVEEIATKVDNFDIDAAVALLQELGSRVADQAYTAPH